MAVYAVAGGSQPVVEMVPRTRVELTKRPLTVVPIRGPVLNVNLPFADTFVGGNVRRVWLQPRKPVNLKNTTTSLRILNLTAWPWVVSPL